MTTRINLGKAAPQLYKSMEQMEQQSVQLALDAGLDKGFCHVLKLRASQINGCAFCLRMHTRDALAAGESADRLSVLPGWRESRYFSELEAAALALIEAVTQVADGQVPDAVYQQAEAALSDAQIAAVQWLGVVINGWNRIAIGSRYPVAP
ncbi:carboxymuconolactone decarboxylase family protein [Ottowia sp.]|uniref:carboxymuconolactone decarboxylase family protein n=1 Tax=Ottowia sp. TaxID=1898956 RepID=UPI003A88E8A3